MGRIFISYMREDTRQISSFFRLLKANNLNAWIDRSDIHSGLNWKKKLIQAIGDSDYFIPCFSKSYSEQRRSYFNKEVRIALGMMDEVHDGKEWMLPVRLDNVTIPRIEVDDFDLADIQYSDLFGEKLTANLDRLLSSLGVDQPDLRVIEKNGIAAL